MDEHQALVDDVCRTVLADAPEVQKMLRLLFKRRHEALDSKVLAELIKRHNDEPFSARDRARKQCDSLRKKLDVYATLPQAKQHRLMLTLPGAQGKGYLLRFEERPQTDQRMVRAAQTADKLWPELKPLFLHLCTEQLWYLPELCRTQMSLPSAALGFFKSFSQPACVVTTLDEQVGCMFPLLLWDIYQQRIHSECTAGTHSAMCTNATKYSYTIDFGNAPADRSIVIPLQEPLVKALGIETQLIRIGCHEAGFLVFGSPAVMDETIGPLSLHPNILARIAEKRDEAINYLRELERLLGNTQPGSIREPKKQRLTAPKKVKNR